MKHCLKINSLINNFYVAGTFILADTCLARMKQTQKSMTRSQIIDSLARMRTMRCGLIQTWEQLEFCLQSIEDGMLGIEFST